MKTFEEYQAIVSQLPVSLRNSRDRINFPVIGLQQEAGKIGSLLTTATASGNLTLTQEQRTEIQARLADILWCVAVLCRETNISLQDIATHSAAQIRARAKDFDPNQR